MEIFTVKELSNYLNCSVSTVRSLVRKREIPFFRIGSKLYFKKSAIDLWIQNQELKNLQYENSDIKSIRIVGDIK